MSEETTNLTVLARQDAERRRTLIALVIAGVALAFALWWAVTNPFEPSPGPDPSAAPSPMSTIAPVRQGEVTTAAGLPDALPLTNDVLSQVESLWSLVTFRGNVINDQRGVVLAGPSILYLVSPTGDTYQVANMDALGADALLAWDPARNVALLTFDLGESVRTFDLASGAVGPAIDPCDGAAMMIDPVGTAGDGNWRLYTFCGDATNDRTFIHSASVGDRGELVWDDHLVYVAQENWLTVSGDVHITSTVEWLEPVEGDPSTTAGVSTMWIEVDGVEHQVAPPPFAPVCAVVGPGRGGTIAARCESERSGFIWELSGEGAEPYRAMRLDQFPLGSDGEVLYAVSSCVAGDALAVQWSNDFATERALTLVQDREVTTVMIDQHPATHCFGASGNTMLIGGNEGLALLNTTTGAIQQLIVSPTPAQLGLDPDQWVRGVVSAERHPWGGAEHQGSILAP